METVHPEDRKQEHKFVELAPESVGRVDHVTTRGEAIAQHYLLAPRGRVRRIDRWANTPWTKPVLTREATDVEVPKHAAAEDLNR